MRRGPMKNSSGEAGQLFSNKRQKTKIQNETMSNEKSSGESEQQFTN